MSLRNELSATYWANRKARDRIGEIEAGIVVPDIVDQLARIYRDMPDLTCTFNKFTDYLAHYGMSVNSERESWFAFVRAAGYDIEPVPVFQWWEWWKAFREEQDARDERQTQEDALR
jgi:hypothetical protein